VDAQRAFWTIKHGIKMSAMPAWGKSLDDATVWEIVAFVRKLPAMTPEQYQRVAKWRPG
jgi:mono/diheme cytochrome c family protein